MRWLCVLLISCAIAPVLAQSSSDSSRQLEAGKSAELENWAWRARRGRQLTEVEQAVQAVLDGLAKRDCVAAAAKLNAGLAKGYPEIVTLAGAMYEEGVCLKQNWDRALNFYLRAMGEGHAGAAARVAAGYAAPVGGRDMAAALWWGLRAKTALPATCTQVAPLADDADRFVAALNAWPAGQLNACAYAVAVMATIQSEVESAGLGAAFGLEGKVRFSLVPEQGRVDVATELVDVVPAQGMLIDAATLASEAMAARRAFSAYLRQLADRALKRYDKPVGIAPGWRADAEFVLSAAR